MDISETTVPQYAPRHFTGPAVLKSVVVHKIHVTIFTDVITEKVRKNNLLKYCSCYCHHNFTRIGQTSK